MSSAFLALNAWAQPTVDFLVTNRFVEPHSVAVDANNKFYITDSADHRVFKYDPDNAAVTSHAKPRILNTCADTAGRVGGRDEQFMVCLGLGDRDGKFSAATERGVNERLFQMK